MHRRALIRGSVALGLAPILGKSHLSFAQDASPTAVEPVLPVTFTDASGTEITVTDVSRLVVLNGDLTEMVFALGLGENIVAVDVSATFPPQVRELPSVGYQLAISAEAVLSFQPTVVIGRLGFVGPEEVLDQIRSAGVPLILFDWPEDIATPAAKARDMATALGIPEVGVALGETIDAEIEAATSRVAGLADDEKPKVMFILFRAQQGLQLIGGAGTPLDAMIPAAGGIHVGAEIGIMGYQQLTPESLIAAAPDAIILQANGYESIGGEAGLLEVPGIAETPAGQNSAFFAYDDLALLALGPRTGAILNQMISDIHPELASATPTA
jgi:iron complex transport system substrate-binding protein